MATQTVTVATQDVVSAFIALQESNRGTELAAIFARDAVLDLNVPQWRFQVGGDSSISRRFAESFPAGLRTVHYDWKPTPTGGVVEYDGWDVAHDTYYRHLAVLTIDDGLISRLTIYCTGPWNHDTIGRQHREAPMVDAEPTGGAR